MRQTSRTSGYLSSENFPVGVKWLLISNIALFVIYFLAVRAGYGPLLYPFGLIPGDVLGHFAIWQLVTYLFLHNPLDFWHILFNMLSLWMFGAELERTWGRRVFLRYYFLCGIGAGLCVVVGNALFGNMGARTIGASGAIYGLLLAWGVIWPDRIVLFSFLFPIKVKYMVMIMGGIAFLSTLGSAGGGTVSHIAHLGGMIFGYLYLKGLVNLKTNFSPQLWARQRYQQYRIARAKRKFQVYMKKHDRDPYVH
jgi:membrane associated rhomboid family serine protease